MKQDLKTLLARLDSWQGAIPLAILEAELHNTALVEQDFRRVAAFGAQTYRRNLLHEGPGYHALVLCWRAGQRSPIHDHCGSSCAVQVLDGVATETAFALTAQGLVYATGSVEHARGSVIGSFDADAHQISNLQPPGDDLITLHLYSPALLQMNRYSLTDPQVESFIDPIEYFAEGSGI